MIRANPDKQRVIGWAVIVVAAVVCGLPSLFYPLSPDHGIIGTVGSSILAGGVPYKDAWDFKPPAVFFLFALSAALLGKHMIVIRVVDLIWQTVTAFVVARGRPAQPPGSSGAIRCMPHGQRRGTDWSSWRRFAGNLPSISWCGSMIPRFS